jgi:hypothetical protein
MNTEIKPPGEDCRIRCPRLGHQVSFSYCRSENQGIPCFKTLDCWFDRFPVEKYLRKELSSSDWDRVFSTPPTPKLLSLFELVEQAKERNKD